MRPLLLVEDHFIAQDLIRLFLERHGFEVVCANDAETALILSQERAFNVIMIDLGLPDADGLDLIKLIQTKKLNKHSIFIAITGHADLELKESALKAGYVDLLEKPLTEFNKIGLLSILEYLKKHL